MRDFLNRWSPWRLHDEILGLKHHLSLCVDALSRIYKERQFIGLEHETADLMSRALTAADPTGELATLHFRLEDGVVETKHPAFRLIAEMFLRDMEAAGAENYQSVTFHSRKGSIEVLARFTTGMTPAEKNRKLEAEVRSLTQELTLLKDDQRFKAPNDTLQKRVDDWMNRATGAECERDRLKEFVEWFVEEFESDFVDGDIILDEPETRWKPLPEFYQEAKKLVRG